MNTNKNTELLENEKTTSEQLEKNNYKKGIQLYGYQMVLLWLTLFFIIFYPVVSKLNIIDTTIIYWCLITIFVFIFEMMFMIKYKYVCDKGNYYYNTNNCYWNEKVGLYDMFSDKMYMDLYADYSLADYKYRQNMNDSGFHFVYFGEIWHGIFAGFLSILVLYFKFFSINNKNYQLAYFTLGITQLVMITWYMSPAILELFLENNQNHWTKTWWPPYLWNVPWFILPSILIYYGTKNFLRD